LFMSLSRDDKKEIAGMILTAFSQLIESDKVRQLIRREMSSSIGDLDKRLTEMKSLVGPNQDYIDRKFAEIYKKEGEIDSRLSGLDGKIGTEVKGLDGRIGMVGTKTDHLQKSLILIVNLEYLFALMAKEYKQAVVDIKEYTEKKEKRDYAWKILKTGGEIVGGALLVAAGTGLVIGLNACSYGIAGTVVAAIGIPMLAGVCALTWDDNEDSSELSATKNYIEMAGSIKDLAKDGIDKTFSTLKEISSDMKKFKTFYSGDWLSDSTLVDPYDFFLDAQVRLKRLQQDILTLDVNPNFDDKVKGFWQESKKNAKGSLYDLTETEVNCLLQSRETDPATKKFWKSVEDSMGAFMRRFVWRNYCRSHWGDKTGRYAVRMDGRTWTLSRESTVLTKKRPSNWPNDIWARERDLWPRHFERICADFMDRNDPKGSETHRSRMVVQCCQVQQGLKDILHLGDLQLKGKLTTGGLLLDLSVIEAKMEPVPNTKYNDEWAGKTAVQFLTGQFKDLTDNETKELFYEARTKGGGNVGIIELRAGEYRTLTVQNETRGTLGIWYAPLPPALVPMNSKLSVILRSTVLSSNTVVLKICKCKGKEADFLEKAWKPYDSNKGFEPDPACAENLTDVEMKKMCSVFHNDPAKLVIGDKNFLTHKTQHINLHLTETGLFSIVLEHKTKAKHKDKRAHKGDSLRGLFQGNHDLKGLTIAEDKWFFKVG